MRIFKRCPLMIFVFALVSAQFAEAQLTAEDGAKKVEAFRTQFTELFQNLKVIGSAIHSQKMIEESDRGIRALQQVTEEQWQQYASAATSPGAVPELAPLFSATTLAVSRIQALASPMLAPGDEPFPEFDPNYPPCPTLWDDPAFMFAISTIQLVHANILTVLQFVCQIGIPIPIIGGCINFSFLCIPFSIALGVIGVLNDQMSTCRLINGRSSNRVMHNAAIYVDNVLRSETTSLQELMETNTAQNLHELKAAEDAINSFQISTKETVNANIAAAVSAMKYSLINDANKNFSSIENSIISTTTSGIETLTNESVSHAAEQAEQVIKHASTKTTSILAQMNSDTQAILANIRSESDAVLDRVLLVGCEQLRLKGLPASQRNSQMGICSTSYEPGTSGTPSLAAQSNERVTVELPAVESSGCSAQGTQQGNNWSSFLMFSIFAFLLRSKRKTGLLTQKITVTASLMLVLLAFPLQAQTTTAESFRADFNESMIKLQQYLQNAGMVNGQKEIQSGLEALEKVTDSDLEYYFAQAFPDAQGNGIPDLKQLVSMADALASKTTFQVRPLDLLTPPSDFPAFGRDFCPARTPDDALYVLTVVNNVLDLVMAVMTYICLQNAPATCNQITVWICIALSAVQAAINIAYGTVINCAFVEGGPPTYESLNYIQLDILKQFEISSDKANLNSNAISQQIVATQNSVIDADFEHGERIIEFTRANLKAAQNFIIADGSSNLAQVEYLVIATTADSLARADFFIKQNAENLAAQIIAHAEEQADSIIARAKLNAKTILDNVKENANKILETTRVVGCRNIEAESQPVPLVNVDICRSQPGF